MKIRFCVVILLCGILGALIGCGSRGEAGDDPEKEEQEGKEELEKKVEREEPEEQGAAVALSRMELLQAGDPDNENLADQLQRAGGGMMVQLQAGSLLGSGVICGAEGDRLLILTAAHVLEEAKDTVAVTFADGICVPADDFTCYETGDFALVRIPALDMPEDTLEQCLCASLDKAALDAAVEGQGCIVMGSSSGVAAEAYEGVILDHWIYMEDYGQYMMWVKAAGKQGMSGGGLFDRQGHLLGIISGGNEDGELAVVPLSLILAEAEQLQLSSSAATTARP